MSCEKCNEAQDTLGKAYFRWGNANIELNGCDEHLGEIFFLLNLIQSDYPELMKAAKDQREIVGKFTICRYKKE